MDDKTKQRLKDVKPSAVSFGQEIHNSAQEAEKIEYHTGESFPVILELNISQAYELLNVLQFVECLEDS